MPTGEFYIRPPCTPSLAKAAGLDLFPTGQHHQGPRPRPRLLAGLALFLTSAGSLSHPGCDLDRVLYQMEGHTPTVIQGCWAGSFCCFFVHFTGDAGGTALMEGMWLLWQTAGAQGLAPTFLAVWPWQREPTSLSLGSLPCGRSNDATPTPTPRAAPGAQWAVLGGFLSLAVSVCLRGWARGGVGWGGGQK